MVHLRNRTEREKENEKNGRIEDDVKRKKGFTSFVILDIFVLQRPLAFKRESLDLSGAVLYLCTQVFLSFLSLSPSQGTVRRVQRKREKEDQRRHSEEKSRAE